MQYLGDYAAGDIIDFLFNTRQFSTGAPFALAGSPALAAYKDNSTTQETLGLTLTNPFDSVTGMHHVRLDTSAAGSFYTDGSQFQIVLTAGTVDSVSVAGTVIARFTLRDQAVLYPTTAGRKLDVTTGGEAGVDSNNFSTPTGSNAALGYIAAGTAQSGTASSITLAAATSFVDDLIEGATIVITGGTGVGQSRTVTDWTSASDLAAVSPDWETTPDATSTYTVFGTPPANLTNLPNVNVSSIDNGVITANAIASSAITNAKFAAGAIDAAALATDAAGEIADSVWDEARAGHVVAGSFGEGVASVQGNVTGSVASVTGAVGSVTGAVGSVGANGITAASLAADVTTELQSGLATAAALDTVDNFLDTEIAAILAAVDTEVAAIKAKTDSLTFTTAGQVDANIQYVNDVAVTGNGGAGTEWGP